MNRSPALRSHPARPKGGPQPTSNVGSPLRTHALLHLQDRIGNRAAASVIQAKLQVSEPGDVYEQEADRVAEEVTRSSPAKDSGGESEAPPRVQRKCAACGQSAAPCPQCTEKDLTLQAKPAPAATSDSGGATHIDLPGSGQPLSAGVRAFFEPRFGRDFSTVRVHQGAEAAQSARALGALAYTVGPDIVFGSGQYAPDTNDGKKLLAHELAHAIQQRSVAPGKIQRRAMPFNAESIAEQLDQAMKGWGTDEESIYSVLSGRTREQTDAIAAAYLRRTGRDLQADLESELTAGELLKLGALAPTGEDSVERRAVGVAERLHEAMRGWGTDEAAIYAALNGRSPDDLAAIKAAYLRLTGRELIDDLHDELSGDELHRALGAMGIAPTVFEHNTELGMLSVGNFDFHFRDCRILIWVWLRFKFASNISPKEQSDFKTRFLFAVHAKWANSGYSLSGGASCPCSTVPIEVHAENSNGYYHKLVDVERYRRREVVISDINVGLNSSDLTLAHEFGHVLGLYDEYDGGFIENSMFWHRNRTDDPTALMSGKRVRVMTVEGLQDGTIPGTELRERYFEHYRQRAQTTAPAGCRYTISSPVPPV